MVTLNRVIAVFAVVFLVAGRAAKPPQLTDTFPSNLVSPLHRRSPGSALKLETLFAIFAYRSRLHPTSLLPCIIDKRSLPEPSGEARKTHTPAGSKINHHIAEFLHRHTISSDHPV